MKTRPFEPFLRKDRSGCKQEEDTAGTSRGKSNSFLGQGFYGHDFTDGCGYGLIQTLFFHETPVAGYGGLESLVFVHERRFFALRAGSAPSNDMAV